MKKYYIFSINKEFYKVYKNNQIALYRTLSNLYKLKLKDAYFGILIFNQLCNPINKKIIKNCLNSIDSMEKIYIIDNNSLLEINASCLVLVTENSIPNKIKNLQYYETPLFICDFKNTKYYFLKKDDIL